MVDMTVEIVTSRAIAAQILRHRSFSFQEFSQRYAEVTEMEPVQLRNQAVSNRQSSVDPIDENREIMVDIGCGVDGTIRDLIDGHIEFSQALYKALIKEGVAKECARFVLPLTTQTTIYMKGSIRSWIHYLEIRCNSHSQLEHQQVALAILEVFKSNFPNISNALCL